MTTAQERQAVIGEARTWIGTPHRHHSRIKGAGVDCGLFLAAVFESCGVAPHVDPGPYPADWMMHRDEERYLGLVEQHARRVERPQPADVALFRFGRCISHGAIVIAWPLVIHSVFRVGVTLDDITANARYGRRLAGFWSPWGAA